MLFRVMRALASIGVFAEAGPDVFTSDAEFEPVAERRRRLATRVGR